MPENSPSLSLDLIQTEKFLSSECLHDPDTPKTEKKNPTGDICFYCCCDSCYSQKQNCHLHTDANNKSGLSHPVCHSCCPECLSVSTPYPCAHMVWVSCTTQLHSYSPVTAVYTWEFPARVKGLTSCAHLLSASLPWLGVSISVMRL